ncbi:MAG: UDP-N-acetylglucosamine-N-acetylmuramyl-(pentapeptide) pyrophosphoryl-undecaprenol N-acetylglucosamine transferase [Chloroflexi bacterium CSP1-4]|nr:MAG: UDP-N-acetylglucosamine-N-acetylmuramyl-(pentapeptide) pyrophosphoryl-undecaprenol N-acetylglucosamine transferase [Chloroflexi bacterium CSP1-4]
MRSLRERRTDVDPLWVGGHRGLEASLVPGAHIPLTRLWLRSLRTVDRSLSTFLDPLRLAGSIPQALLLLARWQPRAVFTTGGYVAIPVLLAARLLRVPSLLWEGNLVPGRSVRATAGLASAIAVSFEATGRALPGPCYVTGTPTRPLAGLDGAAARERLGIETSERVVLVFGGSQAVRRFDDAVDAALPSLVQRATVIHVTGEAGYGAALRRREALPEDRRQRYRPYAFLREEMADALVAADLVVGRAGSSTLAEVTALGLPMVVVPYPHAGGHQRANARTLGEAGAAIVIEDAAFDGDALLAAASVLDDAARLAAMGAASRSLGRRGAAEANAELLLALAERRPLPGDEVIAAIARGAA